MKKLTRLKQGGITTSCFSCVFTKLILFIYMILTEFMSFAIVCY